MGTNGINKNRRKFFQTTAALIGGAIAGTFLKPIELIAQTNEEAPEDQKKENLPLWGMGVDIDKCIGCGKCAEACKIENNVPKPDMHKQTGH